MRNFLSVLLMILLTSFLVISCGGDDDPKESYTCSLQVTDGTCPTGKVCTNGQCVTKPIECTPACDATSETCNNGTCECKVGFHKDGTACVADVVECDPACGDHSTCDAGDCKCDAGFHKDGTACVADQVSGGVGSACAADTDCTDTGAKCNTQVAGGYCSEQCTGGNGSTCLTSGVCYSETCFKKCASDTECTRDGFVCQLGGICFTKCTADADCGDASLECEVATGHCKIKQGTCDEVTNDGCAAGEACKTLQDQQGNPILMCASTTQYPFTEPEGAVCDQSKGCAATLTCIVTEAGATSGICKKNCNDANPCDTGKTCKPLNGKTYGVCSDAQ